MKVSAQESNQINSKNCSQVTITNDLTVELLDPETFVLPQESSNYSTLSDLTGSATNANTYWKAYITITYSKTSSSVNFSKVDGYWTQLRGTTTLSNRYVFYGGNFNTKYVRGSAYPTENAFSYDTGFGDRTYNSASQFGAYSQADITTYAGYVINFETTVDVSL